MSKSPWLTEHVQISPCSHLQPGSRRPPAPVLPSPWAAPTAWTGRSIRKTNPRATTALHQPRRPRCAAPPHPRRAAAVRSPMTRVAPTVASRPGTTAQPLPTFTNLTMTRGHERHSSPGTPSSPPTTQGARRRPGLCEGPNEITTHRSLLRRLT